MAKSNFKKISTGAVLFGSLKEEMNFVRIGKNFNSMEFPWHALYRKHDFGNVGANAGANAIQTAVNSTTIIRDDEYVIPILI